MSAAVITECRVCGDGDLLKVLPLGDQPLANALKPIVDAPEQRYPLTLMFCGSCGLVQIAETVDKTELFSHYLWVTGTSETARRFARRFFELAIEVRPLTPNDLVIEIASNDGTFLKPFIESGTRAIGVDPAANIAAMANANGVTTQCAFWNEETAREIVASQGQATLVVARNVIAHVSELHDVIAGIGRALHSSGVAAIEYHAANSILEGLQYDSIYHEHLCYFSATSFARLLGLHGLHPFHVESSPISGGAHIIYAAKTPRPLSPQYSALIAHEQATGVAGRDAWLEFGRRCVAHREASRQLMARFAGSRVIGFGASARSATYLNFCGFTGHDIEAIVDSAPLKQGNFTPGSTIPIVTAEQGFALNPDLVFVLGWNFRDEIMNVCRQQGYRGDFLVPFPDAPYLMNAQTERAP